MSWWIYLDTETRDGEAVCRYERNITHNLNCMYRSEADLPDSLGTLNGLTGEQARPRCEAVLLRLLRDPEKYREMEDASGWGDYDGAVKFLCEIIAACAVNPSGTWRARG